MQYKGPSLNRSQIADMYNISLVTLRDWLKEIKGKIDLGKRRILKPIEINVLFQEWGIPDGYDEMKKAG